MKDSTGLETSTKIYFFGHLQPGVHKNLEGLDILILEFDDVIVKALSSQWLVFIR